MTEEKKDKPTETYSFKGSQGDEQRVHRLAEYYGKGHLSFSEKVKYLLEKLDTLTEERTWKK